MNETFEQLMENERPVLTPAEQSLLFSQIEAVAYAPVVSPYSWFTYSRSFVTAVLLLVVLLTTSGTVLASEAAKPGDILFPVERAREEVQLLLARNEDKGVLKEQFATERLHELKEIFDEEQGNAQSPRFVEAVDFVKQYVEGIDDESQRDELNEALQRQFMSGDAVHDIDIRNGDTRIKSDGEKVEIRDGKDRVEVRDDGEVRIKYDDGSSTYEYRQKPSDDVSEVGVTIKKFEVRVEEGRAEIRLEYGGVKQEYETDFDSEEDLVVEAAARSGLAIEDLLQSLDIEYKD